MSWFDKAEEELEQGLAEGHITLKEFNAAMRDLRAEYREQAEQCAEEARQDYMGNY